MNIILYNYTEPVSVKTDNNNIIKYIELCLDIANDKIRTLKIIDIIVNLINTDPSRKILIICRFVMQVYDLRDILLKLNIDVGVFTNSNKRSTLPENQIIITSLYMYDAYQYGLPINIDTLLSTVTMMVEQTDKNINILKKSRSQNKKHYIQICDSGCPFLKRQYFKILTKLLEYNVELDKKNL